MYRQSPSSRRAWIEIGVSVNVGGTSEVALLAEGVDRNSNPHFILMAICQSPSSRRAWIEISSRPAARPRWPVALLAEGVDRNPGALMIDTEGSTSPSSRRAWIEMPCVAITCAKVLKSPSSRRAWIEIIIASHLPHNRVVALLAEGVDRNALRRHDLCQSASRPPRGGRG